MSFFTSNMLEIAMVQFLINGPLWLRCQKVVSNSRKGAGEREEEARDLS